MSWFYRIKNGDEDYTKQKKHIMTLYAKHKDANFDRYIELTNKVETITFKSINTVDKNDLYTISTLYKELLKIINKLADKVDKKSIDDLVNYTSNIVIRAKMLTKEKLTKQRKNMKMLTNKLHSIRIPNAEEMELMERAEKLFPGIKQSIEYRNGLSNDKKIVYNVFKEVLFERYEKDRVKNIKNMNEKREMNELIERFKKLNGGKYTRKRRNKSIKLR